MVEVDTPLRPPTTAVGTECVDWFGDASVLVVDLAMACCAVESSVIPPGARRLHLDPRDVPASAMVVVVVSGTVSQVLAPLVAREVAAWPGARVIAFGGCACAGGPYWDASCIARGVDQIAGGVDHRVHVDSYVPGCPPPPEALDAALLALVHPPVPEVLA